jgi:putative SbcD/Mre11-related phosphoesterase
MQLLKKFEIIGLALKVYENLVISDLHIGYEEALNKQGVLIPRFQFEEIMKNLEGLFKKVGKVNRVIINGDLKHEFGTISNQEWRHTLKVLDFLELHCDEVLIIKGNHDTIIGPIAKKRKVKVVEQFIDKDVIFLHGDKIVDIPKKVKTIIIGHEHPAVTIKDKVRAELFKCYLVGKFKGKELIVMPSFHFVQEGHDMLKEKVLSPYLKQDLDDFRVLIVSKGVYDFGKLKGLK